MKNIFMSEFNDKLFVIFFWIVEFGVKYGFIVEFIIFN